MEQPTKQKNKKIYLTNTLAILFWLGVWQLSSMAIDSKLILPSPIYTLEMLFSLLLKTAFWFSMLNSFFRISLGFIIAVVLGVILATVSSNSKVVKALLAPVFSVMKTIPVASFIILAILWASSKHLGTLTSFLMVLPIIYTNTLQGISSTDTKLLEMSKVFKVKWSKKILAIYLPAVMPFFMTACRIGLGLCWKSGVAAEVIGLPANTLGDWLYQAKIFLLTGEVFAVTIVIIVISVLFEKCFMFLLSKAFKYITKGAF